jgi:hypothetical protein
MSSIPFSVTAFKALLDEQKGLVAMLTFSRNCLKNEYSSHLQLIVRFQLSLRTGPIYNGYSFIHANKHSIDKKVRKVKLSHVNLITKL